MSDDVEADIRALQTGDDSRAQRAFGEIARSVTRTPGECAIALSRALREEQTAGALRTPRLLTLLGLTRESVPECVPLCLGLLRSLTQAASPPPSDALIAAAAIVARTEPRAHAGVVTTLERLMKDESAAVRERAAESLRKAR